MAIDLRRAMNCIEVMKEYGTYRGEKIGRVVSNFYGEVSGHNKGDIILFKQENDKTLTVEIPMSQRDIDEQRAMKSLLTTFGAIVNVPKRYVEEIVMS